MTQKKLEVLTRQECFELLPRAVVGRLAFVDDEGPGAVPVNYGIAGEDIVFRVETQSHLREVLPRVAFEVDHVEPDASSGWSVLVRGEARELDLDEVPAYLEKMHTSFPHPWAEGVHNVWVAITPRTVTGRRLEAPFVAALF
ncbi:MAG: pyridoxamine 5'-phosphate oxidase family protein [Acidimicrobiales bacterium]